MHIVYANGCKYYFQMQLVTKNIEVESASAANDSNESCSLVFCSKYTIHQHPTSEAIYSNYATNRKLQLDKTDI
jgi:hypothetical protein